MRKPIRYTKGVRDRAVQVVLDHEGGFDQSWGPYDADP